MVVVSVGVVKLLPVPTTDGVTLTVDHSTVPEVEVTVSVVELPVQMFKLPDGVALTGVAGVALTVMFIAVRADAPHAFHASA